VSSKNQFRLDLDGDRQSPRLPPEVNAQVVVIIADLLLQLVVEGPRKEQADEPTR